MISNANEGPIMASAGLSWVDVHTHVNMLETTPQEALIQAQAEAVHNMITIGTCPDDLPLVLELARKFFPRITCTLGVHPHEAELYSPEVEAFIRAQAPSREVVAIGETGLDYYYDNAPREKQIAVFRAQMKMASELNLPVEIHTREAESDTMLILREFKAPPNGPRKGLLHCFTSSWELAEVGLDCGYDISISGVVTFKNAEALREMVKRIPLDRLHIETDAPFLAPVPHRGKKNQPAFVAHVARMVADLKGVELPVLARQLRVNAQALFVKLPL